MRRTWITLIGILICVPLVGGCSKSSTTEEKEVPSVNKNPTKTSPRGLQSPPAPEAPP
jgi:hypothetical protein